MKILLSMLFTVALITNCASGGGGTSSSDTIKIVKKEGFNPNTKRVSTLSVYHLTQKKLNVKGDIVLLSYGATVDGRISEIYGEGIVGGEAIASLAAKLRLNNFEKSVSNLVESQLNGVPFTSDSQKTLSTITEKGKIEALAVPVISQGSDALMSGQTVEMSIIIYDGKSGKVQIVGQNMKVSAKPEDIKLAESKADQARANINLTVIERTNELLTSMRKEIKGSASEPTTEPTKSVETSNPDAPKEEKPEEPLKGLDDWLVSKIGFGLGPIVVGFLGLLFLVL
jgi:hypothetical protein